VRLNVQLKEITAYACGDHRLHVLVARIYKKFTGDLTDRPFPSSGNLISRRARIETDQKSKASLLPPPSLGKIASDDRPEQHPRAEGGFLPMGIVLWFWRKGGKCQRKESIRTNRPEHV